MEMLLQLLKSLILIDSSTKEGANTVVDFCGHWLSERGLVIQEIENNGYKMIVCEIGSGEKTLIFNGHVDVVSGKAELFIPKEKDGKLYGRGAADMKAGVAAMMAAMVELNKYDLQSKIQLQIVSDEESGGENGSGYLAEQGYRGDFVICSEATQLGIGLQAKGILNLDIEVKGRSAHGSRPWEGINAIEKAYQVYEKILKLPFLKENSEFYSSPSINLAKIQGGDVYNKVPDQCILSFDIRFLPTQNKEEILQQIESVTDGKMIVSQAGEPVRTDPRSPFIPALSTIIGKYATLNLFGQHGSADTRFYSAYGIPAVEFGPSGANWHGDEEYVIIDSVEQYLHMIVEFAREFHMVK
ncbi:M20 family metallopeptidase [Bacillota bacterium Lsc_1132]